MSVSSGSGSPVTPSRQTHADKQELSKWTKDEIVQRVLDLEYELTEFQESSKELEKALEEELQTLEANSDKLSNDLKQRDAKIQQLTNDNRDLKLQLNLLDDQINNKKLEYETEVRTLKQQIVDIEIANDNMESNDRLIQNKLDGLSSFNLELIEKIAMMENDIHLERKSNIEKDLFIINYENTISDLKNQIVKLEAAGNKRYSKRFSKLPSSLSHSNRLSTNGINIKSQQNNDDKNLEDNDHETEISEVDILYLSMKDVLRAGPPTPHTTDKNSMKKSDSLQKLHDLLLKSEGLSNKVKSLRRESLYLNSPQMKSPSTTQLSNYTTQTKAAKPNKDHKENKENRNPRLKTLKSNTSTTSSSSIPLDKSKTSKNLTNMLYKESMNTSSVLDPILGSPDTNRNNGYSKEQVKKKKSKTGNILGSWFH